MLKVNTRLWWANLISLPNYFWGRSCWANTLDLLHLFIYVNYYIRERHFESSRENISANW
jgi:hypothetical protein